MNNDNFTVLVRGCGRQLVEWACLLHGHCIQNDQGEQRICIRFCIKLEHAFTETIWMSHKATAIGNWWLAASSQQCTCSCIVSHAGFFGETSNHSGDSVPLQPRLGALQLLAFPKTKITFEREEISDHQWDSWKYDRATGGDWENCVRSQGAYFEGAWGVIAQCTFLVFYIFFSEWPDFSYCMAGCFLGRLCTHTHTHTHTTFSVPVYPSVNT